MWKLFPKVTLVVFASLPGLVFAQGNDGFERDNARKLLRQRRLSLSQSNDRELGLLDELKAKLKSGTPEDDRELGLLDELKGKLKSGTPEDDRELGLLDELKGKLKSGGSEDDRDLKNKVKIKCRDDDRELKNKVKIKGCDDLAEDNRELLIGTLLSAGIPLLGKLFGGSVDMDKDRQLTELSRIVGDMTEDDRELFFSQLFSGIKNVASNIFNGVKNLFSSPTTQPPASETQAPSEDARELVEYVSQHFEDLTEDNRELLLGTLLSVGVPLISKLFGGSTEDDRELGFWKGFEQGLGDVANVAGDLAPLLIAAKMDDRQLVLNKDQLKKLSRDISDMTDDERELFFGKIWEGIKSVGKKIFDGVKSIFSKPTTQPPASESQAPAEDARELAEYVSQHFGDLTEDNRQLLLGTLLSVGVPLISSLLGGRT